MARLLAITTIALLSTLTTANCGEDSYDQVRFMDCGYGQLAGYYSSPPSLSTPPTTDVYKYSGGAESWEGKGCQESDRTLASGEKFTCDIKPFVSTPTSFKAYVGNVTFNGKGFNCFQDDGHAVHKDERLNQCYSSIYCTHEWAATVQVLASKQTVDLWVEGENVNTQDIVNHILGGIKTQVEGQQCDPTEIGAGGTRSMPTSFGNPGSKCHLKTECKSPDPTTAPLNEMVNIFTNLYATNSSLFSPTKKTYCKGSRVGNECEHYSGVTLPSFWRLQSSRFPPPLYGNSCPGPSDMGFLNVDTSCDPPTSNNALCAALAAMTSAGGATAGAPLFAGLGAAVVAMCA